MKCPIDTTQLMISERHGIEIDYCPTCRGAWLDRGELDKMIDHANIGQSRTEPRVANTHDSRHHTEQHEYTEQRSKKRKKESFLGDLFDF